MAPHYVSSTFQNVREEELIYTAEIPRGGNIYEEVDGIHPPVPRIQQHRVECLKAEELDHDEGDGEYNVANNQRHQQRVHPCWVDRTEV